MESFNARYSFTLGGVRFKIDTDSSMSAKRCCDTADNKDFYNLTHYHPMHEVFFVFDEPLSVTAAGGTREFKNEIVCIPPFFEHRSARLGDYRILFSYDVQEVGSPLADFFREEFPIREISSYPLKSEEIKLYLDELCSVALRGGELEYELSRSLLRLIINYVYKCASCRKADSVVGKNDSYYLITDKLINSCTESEITISGIAEALHLGKKQTARIIKKYYKKPLSVLILEKKLDFSRYLLTATDMKISEICKKSNFRSENYFYIKFKEAYGCTPLRYRAKIKAL